MGMNFTPEQQKVIELHNSNILVSAAAGSGKTAVLVERIIRMICEGEHPADIDRLLIVTFTNAAAAENWITAQNLYGVPLMVFRYYSAVNAFARNPIVRFEPIRFYRFFQSGGRVSSGAADSNSTRSTIFT